MTLENSSLVKKEYAHLDSLYFNSAYFGPSPYRAKQKISNALFKELDPSFYPYNSWMGIPERTRELYAHLLSTSSDNITHSTASSDISSIVANGFPFKKDDVVCTLNGEYPSNVLPWMLAQERGVCQFQLIDLEPFDVQALMKKLPAKTRIFAISHVAFNTGRRVDLLELGKALKSRGIFFIVDATQSFGGLEITPIELANIDVITNSSYKWLLGPYGHAFGYFNNDAIKMIQHTQANWCKSPNSKVVYHLLDYTTETLPGARKFDRGQPSNMLINSALEASLEFIKEVGLNKIQTHNAQVRDYFLENLPKKKYQVMTDHNNLKGNILSLKLLDGDPIALETELKHHNIDVSVREGNVRLSFHLFNTKEQVETLIKALEV